MIGLTGTLVDRKGSYVIPNIVRNETDKTKTYSMRLPQNAVILANNVTIISGGSNLVYNSVSYTVTSEYADIVFKVPIDEPVTIYTYKSISYVDPISGQIILSTPTGILGKAGSAVYNGQIHCIYGQSHYRWDGIKWISVSTVPVSTLSMAILYNNEIHCLGGTDHYKWDGSTWAKVSTLPFNINNGCAEVYNGEIHIAGGTASPTNHYKWNGSTWTQVSTLPMQLARGAMVSYNNELHILGGDYNNGTGHYKWNGSTWTSDVSISEKFVNGSYAVYNNCIYLSGGDSPLSKSCKYFNGTSWTNATAMTANAISGCSVVYDNELHVLYSADHYKYSAATNAWTSVETVETYYALKNMSVNGKVSTEFGKVYIASNGSSSLIEF